MNAFYKYFLLPGVTLLILAACNPAKQVADGKYILKYRTSSLGYYKNIIVDNPSINVDNIQPIIRQKPNRRILGFFRFHMWIYPKDSVKINRKITKHHLKFDKKNKKKIAKGKDTISYRLSSIEKRLEAGEPIILHDSSLTEESIKQIHLYLLKKGFFHNEVTDSLVYDAKKKTCEVYYIITANEPYTIRNINYTINDPILNKYVGYYRKNSVLDSGNNIDISNLEIERNKITKYLQNRGYHFFSKDFISFNIDSTLKNNQVDIEVEIKNVKRKSPLNPDEVIEVTHKRYQIANIYVNTNYNPLIGDGVEGYDTTSYKGLVFLYQKKLNYNLKLLSQFVFISKGEMYRKNDIESTMRMFNSAGVFKSVSIRYEINENDPGKLSLNCFIYLIPTKKQNFSFKVDGTNKGGNFGILGNATYNNKNTFKGAEFLRLGVDISFDNLPLFDTTYQDTTVAQEILSRTFNTIEINPQMSIFFPKFLLPIANDRFKNIVKPKTVLTAALNLQSRPDYSRQIQSYSWTYEWSHHHSSHRFQLIEFNTVNLVRESEEFKANLSSLDNAFLSNSYTDHIILGSQYSFTYNTQSIGTHQDKYYFHANIGSAGFMLKNTHKLMDKNNLFAVKPNEDGQYELLHIPYSQYLRGEGDFRYYHNFNKSSKIVFRVSGGIGYSYGNAKTIPFEKSFFTGGANGLRAWKARTVGPGSYANPEKEEIPDKIGDILLEGNMEYRFDMFGVFEGAFFVDGGNIWTLKEDTLRPGSGISTDFYKQIALGFGFGARFDFDFFIIRLDIATQIHNPSYIRGERWVWEPKDQYNLDYGKTYSTKYNFNLGIGYPF